MKMIRIAFSALRGVGRSESVTTILEEQAPKEAWGLDVLAEVALMDIVGHQCADFLPQFSIDNWRVQPRIRLPSVLDFTNIDSVLQNLVETSPGVGCSTVTAARLTDSDLCPCSASVKMGL